MLDADMSAALSMLSSIGYKEVELYGPYPFSSPSAIEHWNTVTPSLGFKGSGYFGHSAVDIPGLSENNFIEANQLTLCNGWQLPKTN